MGMIPIQEWLPDNWACNIYQHSLYLPLAMKTEPIKLFWTWGWDSTFRLLYILVVEKKHVQPYYIIDSPRESTMHELKAMESIRSDVINKFPETKNLMLFMVMLLFLMVKPSILMLDLGFIFMQILV